MAKDFILNQHLDFGQENPALSALPGGLFVAVWEDNDKDYGETGYDGRTGVYGAVYNGQGVRLTPEFKVPADDLDDQFRPQILTLNDGSWVVAWNSDGNDRHSISNDINVFFQRFGLNTAGQVIRLGSTVQVTPDRPIGDLDGFFDQRLQDLLPTEDGGFRIIYAASDVDTDWEIYSQRFSSTGASVGGERAMEGNIPTYLAALFTQYDPAFDAVPDGNGGYWATYWEGIQGQPTGGSHVWLQHYADDGSQLGTRISVSAMGDPADNEYPVITRLTNGNMVVAWDYQHEEDLQDHDVHMRLIASDGTLLTTISQVNTEQPEAQSLGKILPLANGGFMVTYLSYDRYIYPDDYFDVRARVYDDAGNPIGNSFGVSQFVYQDGDFLTAEVLTDGSIVFAWSYGDTVKEDVYGTILGGGSIPGHKFALPNGTLINNFSVGAGGWTSQDIYPRHIADVNGDGYEDIAGFGQAGLLVSFGSASGTFSGTVLASANFGQSDGWATDNQFHRELADVNGDGREDIIGFGIAGTLVAIAKADGTYAGATMGTDNFGAAQGWASQDGFARATGDVNGDGKADIVGFGSGGSLVALGNGDGTFQAVKLGASNFGVAQGWTSDNVFHRALADVNGDGKADIIGFGQAGVLVSLSKGDGTFGDAKLVLSDFGTAQGWSTQDSFTRLVADVDGDGKADIVGFGGSSSWISYGKADGTFTTATADLRNFTPAQGWASDQTFHRELADINHDGQLDIVGFGYAGVMASLNQSDPIV